MIIEEETVEKIVLPVPESKLAALKESAAKADIPVKEYILRLIDQDILKNKQEIAPEKIAAVMSRDSEIAKRFTEAQKQFDLLTKEQAQATVNMINARLENEFQKAKEIQSELLPRIAQAKDRLLNEIRDLIENSSADEN